jgi:N-methylhydantoinase A
VRRARVPLADVPAGAVPQTPRTRRVRLDGRPAEARVFDRAALGRNSRLVGPAIVEQPDTTVLIPAGHTAEVDRFGNLLIRSEG